MARPQDVEMFDIRAQANLYNYCRDVKEYYIENVAQEVVRDKDQPTPHAYERPTVYCVLNMRLWIITFRNILDGRLLKGQQNLASGHRSMCLYKLYIPEACAYLKSIHI